MVTTPASIRGDDIPVSRLSSDLVDDFLLKDEGDDIASTIEASLLIDPPAVSNPFSGDEGSVDASSPESLSPNAPVDAFDPLDALQTSGSDALDSFKTKVVLEESSPDTESGFAELAAKVDTKLPTVEGGVQSKEYRALVEMSSGKSGLRIFSCRDELSQCIRLISKDIAFQQLKKLRL